ncbi:MAG: hypothetical protein JRG92_18025 [Deltaproteobacteria bacterium]|nr:hypothetical protein [Deltaproteobacteria bacterium]MBW2385533.1 hypothetical protein [Deltaproteobacteria bacterium]MBW2695215.1 hypothetical protein [Deltaproteobacteria bacterium]
MRRITCISISAAFLFMTAPLMTGAQKGSDVEKTGCENECRVQQEACDAACTDAGSMASCKQECGNAADACFEDCAE